MGKIRRIHDLIPPWDMPSDPVKAVLWFMRWLLRVLVRFFWLPILFMVTYETYLNWSAGGLFNGIIGGIITLLIGIGVWAMLYIILLIVTLSTRISNVLSEATRLQQTMTSQRFFYPFNDNDTENHVVEGTITDLEEERKKRRQE